MGLSLAILSSLALLVDSTEASPYWVAVDKRAVAAEEDATTTKKQSTTTKHAVKAVETDPDNKFSNKPTTTTKKVTSAKPSSAKPTSNASSVAPVPSASIASSAAIPSASPTAAPPPLMVTASSSTTSSTASPLSTSAAVEASSGGVSGGAIGGIVAAVVIIILGAVAYLFIRRRKAAQRNNRHKANEPDPFTMGYGSEQAFGSQQPPMQQNYQHQYGVQPSIAVTSPTSPTSPYYSNNNSSQFHDANNHIIAESMIPATAAMAPQPYQTQLQQPPYQTQQQQPQEVFQHAVPIAAENENTHNLMATTAATVAPMAAVTAAAINGNTHPAPLLAPTQAGSVGVFHVAATYTPTLSDEIDIQTGDQVEVLVEYDDGWCQGINLTRGNAKGVFPKHCIDYASGSVASDKSKRVSSMYIS